MENVIKLLHPLTAFGLHFALYYLQNNPADSGSINWFNLIAYYSFYTCRKRKGFITKALSEFIDYTVFEVENQRTLYVLFIFGILRHFFSTTYIFFMIL